MAHDLATTNGKTAMAYFGEVPWHRLGTKLDNPATAEEAIQAAGLGYDVELTRLVTVNDIPGPDRRAVVRQDTNQVLGVVGTTYKPVQNRQCFGFMDAIVSEGAVQYHTAGALGKGERVWMLAKLPDEIRVKNSDDITEKYLLLSNSHDGSSSLRVHFTPIRVVCANTLAVAERKGRGKEFPSFTRETCTRRSSKPKKCWAWPSKFTRVSKNAFNGWPTTIRVCDSLRNTSSSSIPIRQRARRREPRTSARNSLDSSRKASATTSRPCVTPVGQPSTP